jgi:hypothetical protein
MPGRGVVFLTPLRGHKQVGAGTLAGFRKVKTDRMVRVEAASRRGLAAEITGALADAGINIRGFPPRKWADAAWRSSRWTDARTRRRRFAS